MSEQDSFISTNGTILCHSEAMYRLVNLLAKLSLLKRVKGITNYAGTGRWVQTINEERMNSKDYKGPMW